MTVLDQNMTVLASNIPPNMTVFDQTMAVFASNMPNFPKCTCISPNMTKTFLK
jgi:hypothetical protein